MNIQESPFRSGETVLTFEREIGEFIGEALEEDQPMLVVSLDSVEQHIPSSSCFHEGPRPHRSYSLGNRTVKLMLEPLDLVYHGDLVWVTYNSDESEREFFEDGDSLHLDWEGRGIELREIVEKWLRRLNGDIIPLSNYYRDPFNRYLDSLTRSEDHRRMF